MDLEFICRESIDIVRETGTFIRQQRGRVGRGAVEEKSRNSLVSYVDREAEKRLVTRLGHLLPGSTFLTEEDTVDNVESPLQWVIDPLDGTTNFLYQLPCFSVSVALRREQQTVLGIVYEINHDECFYAFEGGGAFLDREPIQVSARQGLSEALLATGFPYYDYTLVRPYLTVLERFMRDSRGIRRFGSAAVDLAYVACGRFDGFFEYALNPWDVAAGAFLVRQAGGQVTDFRGGDDYLFGRQIIAAAPGVYREMQEPVGAAFHRATD